jgi:hypothetical protein
MPVVVFAIYKVYYFYLQGKNSFVIFISIISKGHLLGDFLIFIYTLLVFFFSYVYLLSKSNSLNLSFRCVVYSSGFQNKGNRDYSTSSRSEDPFGKSSEGKGSISSKKNNKSTSKRKTLTSLRVKAYGDLYAGRGIPSNEPI